MRDALKVGMTDERRGGWGVRRVWQLRGTERERKWKADMETP